MSYCKFVTNDVYMYAHPDGFIECYACKLAPIIQENMSALATELGMTKETHPEMFEDFDMNESIEINTRSEALAHLQAHRDAGHVVQERAFELLRKELEEDGEYIIPNVDKEIEE